MASEKVRVVKGPGPRNNVQGPRPKIENQGKIFKRLAAIIMKRYGVAVVIVILCILGVAVTSALGTLFIQRLIDDYITPLIGAKTPDFGPLKSALIGMAGIYALGVICSLIQSQVMVRVSQGTMHDIRVRLFTHMESLPIKYFDTHAHGDIMSVYTNDVDTLRQMIGTSMPQFLNSVLTLATVFVSMVYLSIPLTILSLLMVGLMLFTTGKVAKKSGSYFMKQQHDIGAVNGYIEEMMSGQKVVKVFCHEDESLRGFKELNEQLRDSANNANKYANILMPLTAQMGNISYVICAIIGALFAIKGFGGITIGVLVSFLTLNKNFNMPIAQIT